MADPNGRILRSQIVRSVERQSRPPHPLDWEIYEDTARWRLAGFALVGVVIGLVGLLALLIGALP